MSKELLHSIELSNLLNKIEFQVNNIEKGDAHTEIDRIMSFPIKSVADNTDLRKEAMKELYGMLYKAFGLICQISLEACDTGSFSVVAESCSRIIDILLSCQLKIQKAPMANPLAELHNKAISKLQQEGNNSLISKIKECSNILFAY